MWVPIESVQGQLPSDNVYLLLSRFQSSTQTGREKRERRSLSGSGSSGNRRVQESMRNCASRGTGSRFIRGSTQTGREKRERRSLSGSGCARERREPESMRNCTSCWVWRGAELAISLRIGVPERSMDAPPLSELASGMEAVGRSSGSKRGSFNPERDAVRHGWTAAAAARRRGRRGEQEGSNLAGSVRFDLQHEAGRLPGSRLRRRGDRLRAAEL